MTLASLRACAALSWSLVAFAGPSHAQSTVRIGVLTDLSGPYSATSGPGSVLGTQMAVEDFIAAQKPGFKIELISADHQNKPDIAANKAREWFEKDNVDLVTDLVTSSVALAVVKIAREKNKIAIVGGSATTRLTNEDCTPVSVHWTYDTYSVTHSTARAVTQAGGKSWFFITADYAAGTSIEKDATTAIQAFGGTVLGSARHPFPGSDFSSFLLKAQASGAQVIGLANAGTDLINSIKQAAEFGISQEKSLAALVMFLTDVHSLGLPVAKNLYLTEAFYWDLNDQTRAWSNRFMARHKKIPTAIHAGQYSSTLHYLNAVKAAGTSDTAAVMARMKATPVNDMFAQNGQIRQDGRMIHDMYLFQVKKPEESMAPYDYYHLRATIPAAEAFQPLDRSTCPLVKK